jgi:hypothetical protein
LVSREKKPGSIIIAGNGAPALDVGTRNAMLLTLVIYDGSLEDFLMTAYEQGPFATGE